MTEEQFIVSRRSLLIGAAISSLSVILEGCAAGQGASLQIRALQGSVPPQMLNEFRKQTAGVKLEYAADRQLQELFTLLQAWNDSGSPNNSEKSSGFAVPSWVPFIGQSATADPVDLVTLGDYWLSGAISQGLLAPLDAAMVEGGSELLKNPQWRALVTRDAAGKPDANGKVWAVPYRVGTTVLAYRQDIFKQQGLQPPTDWADLWRPELKGRISLLDQSREVIGLTLKKLGKSYNTENLATVATLDAELRALNQQAKLYSSTHYLQPLLLEDTWVSVGWSEDVLQSGQRSPNVVAVVPTSGTALWADMWVRPAVKPTVSPIVAEWLNFCLQPAIAQQISLLTWGASPMLFGKPLADLPTELRRAPALFPDPTVVKASEFLQPLSKATTEQYEKAWKAMRQTSL
ncbi:extracellular solute-binding protein [Phormidium sp. CLA17]|uniref:extracellular solute-binding protein n=1 Tax=Leptolyngbya sp. Cla-17 TaxID=2803751 RepID=UPI0018D95575|nr:extracellular solute-binding protein [Leptolyngbya sp. Cla-17]MBM0743534.1 extracellular solute-binding protein [Leptolyngbya sp. Cla-17]